MSHLWYSCVYSSGNSHKFNTSLLINFIMMTWAIYTRKCAAINIGESNLLSMVLVLLPKPNGVMHWSCYDSSLVFNLSTFLPFFCRKDNIRESLEPHYWGYLLSWWAITAGKIKIYHAMWIGATWWQWLTSKSNLADSICALIPITYSNAARYPFYGNSNSISNAFSAIIM